MGKRPLYERLTTMLLLCEKSDIRVELEYDNGHYIEGKDVVLGIQDSDYQPEVIKQGKKGWLISINMESFVDDTGKQIIYPTLDEAVDAGMYMLFKHFE